MILEVTSYISTVVILFSYFKMVRSGNQLQFNIVNFITAFPLVALGISAGAYPNAILSGFFGLIGFIGIISRGRK